MPNRAKQSWLRSSPLSPTSAFRSHSVHRPGNRHPSTHQAQGYSTIKQKVTISAPLNPKEVDEMLSRPTWSVKSLLPPSSADDAASHSSKSSNNDPRSTAESLSSASAPDPPEITPQTLQHLHKLSALTPPPRDSPAERRLLRDLRAQLHFVQEIRSRDLRDVEPMGAVRDEFEEDAQAVGLLNEGVRRELEREDRRRKGTTGKKAGSETLGDPAPAERQVQRQELEENWDVLGQAPKKVGRFFIVEGGNANSQRSDGSVDS